MNELNTRAELIEVLEDLRAVEIIARNNYIKDVTTFQNFIISDTIEKIKLDEDRHILVLEKLLKMLKSKR
jgi:hypothetical protein